MNSVIQSLVVALVLGSTSLTAFAGPIRGPLVDTARVQANRTNIYNEMFVAGQTAVISIAGDGDTDLDIYVYDANGNLITRAIGLSDRETVTFVPFVTSNFRIEVRNLGNVWNQYTINMR